MLEYEELKASFPPELMESCITKLTTAFKNNQLIDWESGKLVADIPHKGFYLTHIPLIDIDKICTFLGLPLSGTDLDDMLQYTIRHSYLITVTKSILREVLARDTDLRYVIETMIQKNKTKNVSFYVQFGNPDENNFTSYSLDQFCDIDKNTKALVFTEPPEDTLKDLITEKIKSSEFVKCRSSIMVGEDGDICVSYMLSRPFLDVMYPIIEKFFGINVTKTYTDDELRIKSYQHKMLTEVVKKACANSTILAFKFANKTYGISDVRYTVHN